MKNGARAGVDEAGRGPLAGPVAVCALAVIKPGALGELPESLDSKRFSETRRSAIAQRIRQLKHEGALDYQVVMASAAVIDRLGISKAVSRSATAALTKLSSRVALSHAVLDAGITHAAAVPSENLVRGDSLVPEIGAASIMAKTMRDEYMRRLALRMPGYGFDVHKGYGTAAHYSAIARLDVTKEHRKSFLRSFLARK
jgi:ribonuclease HII